MNVNNHLNNFQSAKTDIGSGAERGRKKRQDTKRRDLAAHEYERLTSNIPDKKHVILHAQIYLIPDRSISFLVETLYTHWFSITFWHLSEILGSWGILSHKHYFWWSPQTSAVSVFLRPVADQITCEAPLPTIQTWCWKRSPVMTL